ncbi:MAG: histidinol-phosphate transaminase [Candidatus Omnitrophota bacterium]|jgi:histidinol-phosphate aminotransferase
MKSIGKDYLKNIDPYKPGKPIDEVKRELGLKDVMKLASNENPIGPAPGVVEAIKKASKDVNRYPDGGCFYLRKALSEKLSVSGNGSDERIVLAIRACVGAGDEVVVADPTFLIYHIASMVQGAKLNVVPLKGYKYDLDAMLDAITPKTKVAFIANPDNPTGSYVTKDELDSFIEKVPEDVLVFIDEAYYEYAKGEDYPETLSLVKRKDRNVVIARTFSKAYSLAGLRVGYGLARPDIADILNKTREPFNVNSLAQVAACAALEDQAYMEKAVSLANEEKKRFYSTFDSLGVKYVPSRTNFILVDTGRDSVKVFEYLLRKGIIVREMSPWKLKGFIRVNVGRREENDAFLEAFKEALKEIK